MAHQFKGSGYNEYRPEHNGAFFSDVLQAAALPKGTVIAEIGAGNGNATLPLLELGYKVIAIETEASMIDKLKAKLVGTPYAQNITILHQPLETITSAVVSAAMKSLGESPAARPDAIFAASALHWLDRKIALPAMRKHLVKEGGPVIGISRLMTPTTPVATALHALLCEINPPYKDRETTFTPDRWSSVEKQAPRFMDGYKTQTLNETRVFKSDKEFIGYLKTVSSLAELETLPDSAPAIQRLKSFFTAHAQEGVLSIPWTYIACTGEMQSRTKPDPFPPSSLSPG